jgi:hypothetical protein
MKRAAIPPPPLVVGGMLGKQDTQPLRLKKTPSPSRHSVVTDADAPQGLAIQRLLSDLTFPTRTLSDPPDLSYQDQNLSANGL